MRLRGRTIRSDRSADVFAWAASERHNHRPAAAVHYDEESANSLSSGDGERPGERNLLVCHQLGPESPHVILQGGDS